MTTDKKTNDAAGAAAADQGKGAPAAGAAGDKTAQGGDANKGDAPGAGSGGEPAGDQPQVYRPDGLADHLAGKTDKETIDKLNAAYAGAREALAKNGKDVPKTAEEYSLDMPEDVRAKVIKPGEDGKDAVYDALRQSAHEMGLTNAQFNGMAKKLYENVVAQMEAAQGQPQPEGMPDMDWEFKSMGGADAVKPIQDGIAVWAQGMKAQGKFDDADVEEAVILASFPRGLNLLTKLREATGEKPIPVSLNKSGNGGEGQITEADLKARVKDERYRKGSKKFDQAFHDETTQMYRDFYNKEGAV